MKKYVLLCLCVLMVNTNTYAENNLQEKRLKEAMEKFVDSTRKSERDYTTISLQGWRNQLGMPPLTTEDMVRKVLTTFDRLYSHLQILDWQMVYCGKPGGGIECDFLVIRHETRKKAVDRFSKK